MEMNRQRKWLIAVLCLGVGGLVMDRFVLAAPDDASAVSPVEITTGGSMADLAGDRIEAEANAAVEEAGATLPSYASLTERLLTLQEEQATQINQAQDSSDQPEERVASDPFALPEEWAPRETLLGPTTTAEPVGITDQAFLDKNRLAATINDPDNKRAVVNGKMKKIGDELDGYQLIQIYPRSVIWASPDGERVIVMRTDEGV